MKTKLILTLIFILLVATLFAGCGNNSPAETANNDISSAVAEETLASSSGYSETTAFVAEASKTTEEQTTQQETEITEELTSENLQQEATEPSTRIKDREPQINFSDLEWCI